ncbi:hypothetical protein LTR36_007221 [Oleoguttula mirabilis]|uniref:Uncharacterized protein n=1 Tax=Oleoguttula mirabilis TaxID=1507867 RepID=A0AAV9JB37_9PEZI|nr:hypothetical protein LTR36_007221 [Oleoguttula mirabilis]
MASIARVRSQPPSLEQELADWLSGYYFAKHGNASHGLAFSPVSAREGSYPLDGSPGIPLKAGRFHSSIDPTVHALYWTYLLPLRQSTWDLTRRRAPTNQTQRDIVAVIDEIAGSLSESVPYMSATAEGLVCKAPAVRAPLQYAVQRFERTQSEEKLQWCRDVEQHIRQEVPFLQWQAVLLWSF